MSKFNAGKASVLALTAVLAVAAFLLGKSITSVNACTTAPVNCAGDWNYNHVCSAKCGGGFFEMVWNITTPASNGGIACVNQEGDIRLTGDSCNTNTCSTKRWCTPFEDGYKAIAVPTNQYPPDDGGKPWVTGMDASCNFAQAGQCPTACGLEASRVPDGSGGYTSCAATPACVSDVCANIDGVQTSVPDGLHLDGGKINCVSFDQAGPPPQGPYTPPQGQVLGASTGKVLGTSIMAGTGSFAENLYIAIMGLGGIITALGVKNFKKGYKVA